MRKVIRERARSAAKNARRRRARTGERYTLDQVAEKTGGRCHLCGGDVDRDRTAGDPLSATRDHLIPISSGGSDTLANVKLAHLACNMRRGARPLEVAA